MENIKCRICGNDSEKLVKGKCRPCNAEYLRKWKAANPDRVKASHEKWHAENYEHIKKYRQDYRAANPEMARESLREWKKRNPEKVLADGRKQDRKRAKNLARKEYMKNQRLKKHFDISLETYRQISEAQGGVCAICHKPETHLDRSGQPRQLCVDHCHKSGKIRQLLCNRCNAILGRAEDDSDMLVKMAEYLKKHKE